MTFKLSGGAKLAIVIKNHEIVKLNTFMVSLSTSLSLSFSLICIIIKTKTKFLLFRIRKRLSCKCVTFFLCIILTIWSRLAFASRDPFFQPKVSIGSLQVLLQVTTTLSKHTDKKGLNFWAHWFWQTLISCLQNLLEISLSWRRSLSYRHQSIDLLCKSMD